MKSRNAPLVRWAIFLIAAVLSAAFYGLPPAAMNAQGMDPSPVYDVATINTRVCAIMRLETCAAPPTVVIVRPDEWEYGDAVLARFQISEERIEVRGDVALHTIGLIVIAHEIAHYQQKRSGAISLWPTACERLKLEEGAHEVSKAYAKAIGQNPALGEMPEEVRGRYQAACDAE